MGPYTDPVVAADGEGGTGMLSFSLYAQALGAEVAGLAAAGARLIQVDEPSRPRRPVDLSLARQALALVQPIEAAQSSRLWPHTLGMRRLYMPHFKPFL